MAVCPNGHSSESEDYCDQCGAPIGASTTGGGPSSSASGAFPAVPAGASPPGSEPVAAAEPCPQCGAPRSGDDRFCEGCGYDFVTAAPVVVAEWEAVTAADQNQFDRNAPDGLSFPTTYSERSFPLSSDTVRIGRGGQRPGVPPPEIDLSAAPEDPGISHMHAVLRRQADGSYAVLDLGSTNGTLLNDDPAPLAAGVEAPLADGDVIRLGAWTTVTVRQRGRPGPEGN
jgi:FHA domain/Double zinc ribbon